MTTIIQNKYDYKYQIINILSWNSKIEQQKLVRNHCGCYLSHMYKRRCNNFQHDDTCSCPCMKQPWSNHTGVAMSSPHHYHQPNQSCVAQASLSCPSSPSPIYRCLESLKFFFRDCFQKNTTMYSASPVWHARTMHVKLAGWIQVT